MPSSFVHFDGMTWPHPEDPNGIEWSLRYKTDLTESERMVAASYVAAYRQLVADAVRVRDSKIRRLRASAHTAIRSGESTDDVD